jgi:hypothetical protein
MKMVFKTDHHNQPPTNHHNARCGELSKRVFAMSSTSNKDSTTKNTCGTCAQYSKSMEDVYYVTRCLSGGIQSPQSHECCSRWTSCKPPKDVQKERTEKVLRAIEESVSSEGPYILYSKNWDEFGGMLAAVLDAASQADECHFQLAKNPCLNAMYLIAKCFGNHDRDWFVVLSSPKVGG